MINSLFMLGSSYNKNRVVSIAFMIGWILYMIIGNISFNLGIFPVVNALVFFSVCIIINIIKNKKVNTVLSIFSFLIWSIIIDIFCYYMYPFYSSNQSIFEYVWQGILYNYKYIFSNIIAICIINALDYGIEYIKLNIKKETKVTLNY